MRLYQIKIYSKVLLVFVIFLTTLGSFVCSAAEWGWRENLNVDVIASEQLLKTLSTHNQHREMYELETLISPNVIYSGYLNKVGRPANICMGAMTLLIQCSPNLVYSVTISLQNIKNEEIVFCSQKSSKLHSLSTTIPISFSRKDSHPDNSDLQKFLKDILEYSVNSFDFDSVPRGKLRKSSDMSSERGHSLATSSAGFGMKFQHTEQKLVYYLLKDNAVELRMHIQKAFMLISNDPSIAEDITPYYSNIVGLILHVHTRLDPCVNCNHSLFLFRKKVFNILNPLTAEDKETGVTSSAVPAEFVNQDNHIGDVPVLVTVSSRARNDTNREITGYDEHWEGSNDNKKRGHIIIKLKSVEKIENIELKKDLTNLKGIDIINIESASTSRKAVPGVASIWDYKDSSVNCYSIFPDVLQKFTFFPL